jgi:hypothetical protein
MVSLGAITLLGVSDNRGSSDLRFVEAGIMIDGLLVLL